jgi:hypothetical protein
MAIHFWLGAVMKSNLITVLINVTVAETPLNKTSLPVLCASLKQLRSGFMNVAKSIMATETSGGHLKR